MEMTPIERRIALRPARIRDLLRCRNILNEKKNRAIKDKECNHSLTFPYSLALSNQRENK